MAAVPGSPDPGGQPVVLAPPTAAQNHPAAPPKGDATPIVWTVLIVVVVMVVLSVVGAMVLYVMTIAFLSSSPPRSIGAVIVRDTDGNFTMRIVLSLPDLAVAQVALRATRGSAVLLPGVPLIDLDCPGEGSTFVKTGPGVGQLEAGDSVLLVGSGNRCAGGAAPGRTFTTGDLLEVSDHRGVVRAGRID